MSESGLELRAIHKRFGDNHVVRGLEIALEAGEIVALLGPSGCGKTTALRMVAGLETPDSGTITIAGQTVKSDAVDLPPEARRIGMVFQSYAVWPHKNVRDNVAYPLKLAKNGDAGARADRTLELVRLGGMGDRFPDTLSGGQQQRVALARALVAEPKLLLFDEPLSNLDAKLREEMRHEIRVLAKQVGITSLYVTHDQPEAFAVSDRVAVVLDGVIAQVAPPREIYAEPASLAVAKFVGRLSILEGVERTGEGRARVQGFELPVTSATDAQSVVLGVRPEDVRLADGGIEGRVTRATFLGERTELEIETLAGTLRADVGRSTPVHGGGTVHVALDGGRLYAAPSH